MNATQRLLAHAARGMIDRVQGAIEDPTADINYLAKDNKGNGLLFLVASTYVGDSAGLTKILIALYDKMKEQDPEFNPLEQTNAAGQRVETYLRENVGHSYLALIAHQKAYIESIEKANLGPDLEQGKAILAAGGKLGLANSEERFARLFAYKDLPGLRAAIAADVFNNTEIINKAIGIGVKVAGTEALIATLLKQKSRLLYPFTPLNQLTVDQLEQLFNVPGLYRHNGEFDATRKLLFAAIFNNQAALEHYLPQARQDQFTLNRALRLTSNANCKAYLRANGAEELPAPQARKAPAVKTAKPVEVSAPKKEGLSLASKVLLGVATVLTGGLALLAYGIYQLAKPSAKVVPEPALRSVSSESIRTRSGSSVAETAQAEVAPRSGVKPPIGYDEYAAIYMLRNADRLSALGADQIKVEVQEEFVAATARFKAEHPGQSATAFREGLIAYRAQMREREQTATATVA